MNKKGLFTYLLVTFGATYLVAALVILFDLVPFEQNSWAGMGLLLGVFWMPALAARLASAGSGAPVWPMTTVWPLKKTSVLGAVVITFLVFVAVYAATTLLGWTEPDWDLSLLMHGFDTTGQTISPLFILVGGFGLTLVLGPTLCALLCLGAELGWRGYFLPRIMSLGRIPAYAVTGLLYGLWVAPLSLMGRENLTVESCWWPVLAVVGVSLILGIMLGEVWHRSQHLGLTAVWAGCFISQALGGIWAYLFPGQVSLWVGPFGLVSMGAWLAVTVAALVLPGAKQTAAVPEPEPPAE